MLEDAPSKTQRKNELERLKKLGAELVELSEGKLAMLELPDYLRRAIDETRKISSRSARKRMLMTVGRCMEDVDGEEIRAQLVAIDHPDTRAKIAAAAKPQPVPVDPLAETLLDGGDAAVFALTDKYARDELQALRAVVRLARKRAETDRAAALADVASAVARLN